ncbi:MAG: Transcriptional regulator, LuxR family [Ramlibacter sp.]|nr:Transcriptional regulator, LuxR family [Ramlibacter sp.]
MIRSEMIKVLVVHDDGVVEAGLRAVVSGESDVQLLTLPGHFRSDEEVAQACTYVKVDVLIVDYERNLRLTELLRTNAFPAPKPPRILVYTNRATQAEIRAALAAGAHGYLLGGCSPSDVTEGVRRVNRGMRHLSELATVRVVETMLHRRLTARETEVLSLLAQGFPNKLIADKLGVEIPTVKIHVAAILEKLGAHNRTEAVAIGTSRGLFATRAPAARPGVISNSAPDASSQSWVRTKDPSTRAVAHSDGVDRAPSKPVTDYGHLDMVSKHHQIPQRPS